jgi:hypothetical protein
LMITQNRSRDDITNQNNLANDALILSQRHA